MFATTNKYESLDEALSRPGRMDVHVEFKLAAKYQARELFLRFYSPQYCEGDTDTSDQELHFKESTSLQPSVPASVTVVRDTGDVKDLRFSMRELRKLADEFAERIPDHVVSMASLQGYLMENQTNPEAALSGVKAWIKKETRGLSKSKKTSSGDTIATAGDVGVAFDSDTTSPFTGLIDVEGVESSDSRTATHGRNEGDRVCH